MAGAQLDLTAFAIGIKIVTVRERRKQVVTVGIDFLGTGLHGEVISDDSGSAEIN